jgi:hypothetical protein
MVEQLGELGESGADLLEGRVRVVWRGYEVG